jgi:DNA-binding NarL/FixJ family response regulator
MLRILIADDHAIMREGLKQLLQLVGGVNVVAEAANGEQVFDILCQMEIDLVLLDMLMPGISGPELINDIRLQEKNPPILVLSAHHEVQVARRALQAGASGYLTKDTAPKILVAAIFKVAAGGRFVDPRLAEQMMFDNKDVSQRLLHTLLSNREFDIFLQLVQGRSVNQIADALSISNKTVSTHKARLMLKMRCDNNAELVRYAISHHLIE